MWVAAVRWKTIHFPIHIHPHISILIWQIYMFTPFVLDSACEHQKGWMKIFSLHNKYFLQNWMGRINFVSTYFICYKTISVNLRENIWLYNVWVYCVLYWNPCHHLNWHGFNSWKTPILQIIFHSVFFFLLFLVKVWFYS